MFIAAVEKDYSSSVRSGITNYGCRPAGARELSLPDAINISPPRGCDHKIR